MQKNIRRLLVVTFAVLSLSACAPDASTAGGSGTADNHLSIGSAPATYNGNIIANDENFSGEAFYSVDIAAGGQYNITMSDFSTDLELYVFDKPFADKTFTLLCFSATYDPIESCTVTADKTATLTTLYIYVSNIDYAPSDLTLTVN